MDIKRACLASLVTLRSEIVDPTFHLEAKNRFVNCERGDSRMIDVVIKLPRSGRLFAVDVTVVDGATDSYAWSVDTRC